MWTDMRHLTRRYHMAREIIARTVQPSRVIPVEILSAEGVALRCKLYVPQKGQPPYPAVMMYPGGLEGVRGLEGVSGVITPHRLARHGIAAMVFGPSGREETDGSEDYNGSIHQAEAALALRALMAHPLVDQSYVVVLSISFGVLLAIGALVRAPETASKVRLFIDWEGPGSRYWFKHTDLNRSMDDHQFWEPREAIKMIPAIVCPYQRLQSRWDHVHGAQPEIGLEMARSARSGRCPQVWFNDSLNPDDWERPEGLVSPHLRDQSDLILTWICRRFEPTAGA